MPERDARAATDGRRDERQTEERGDSEGGERGGRADGEAGEVESKREREAGGLFFLDLGCRTELMTITVKRRSLVTPEKRHRLCVDVARYDERQSVRHRRLSRRHHIRTTLALVHLHTVKLFIHRLWRARHLPPHSPPETHVSHVVVVVGVDDMSSIILLCSVERRRREEGGVVSNGYWSRLS
jgi:hypothetical protein